MYQVEFSESAKKDLKKLDRQDARRIKHWIIRHLVNTDNPRLHGKPLKGNLLGVWRYRVGDYRIFAEIHDDRLVIFWFEIDHRRQIYK